MKVADIAKAVLEAQKIYEESFDKESAGKVMQVGIVDEDDYEGSETSGQDFSRFYKLTMEQAAEKACEELDNGMSDLITLISKIGWNDFQGWAKDLLGE